MTKKEHKIIDDAIAEWKSWIENDPLTFEEKVIVESKIDAFEWFLDKLGLL